MDAHFATFKDALMGLNDDEEPYACCVLDELNVTIIMAKIIFFYHPRIQKCT